MINVDVDQDQLDEVYETHGYCVVCLIDGVELRQFTPRSVTAGSHARLDQLSHCQFTIVLNSKLPQ